MPSFETIVRPFAAPTYAPPKQGVDNIPAVVPDVVLFVGGPGGQGKLLNGSSNHTTTVYVIKRPKEVTSD